MTRETPSTTIEESFLSYDDARAFVNSTYTNLPNAIITHADFTKKRYEPRWIVKITFAGSVIQSIVDSERERK